MWAFEQQAFDLVLMDVQMPKLDGLEATRLIRKAEQATGTHTPIIAMTAGAMKGDEERCFESGMDGYVSKPIDPELLYEEIKRCTRSSAARPHAQSSNIDEASIADVIDIEVARRLCRNDDQQLRALAQTLLNEAATLMEDIRSSLDEGDVESFRRFVHTLKGSAGVFGAAGVVDAAIRIQDLVTRGSLDGLHDPVTDLLGEVESMMGALSTLSD